MAGARSASAAGRRGTLLVVVAGPLDSAADEPGGAMEGWARVAWLVGLVAVLVLAWERRRWRRVDAGAPPGSRVLGRTGIVLGATGLAVAVGGLLLERRWNRRRPGKGTDRHTS